MNIIRHLMCCSAAALIGLAGANYAAAGGGPSIGNRVVVVTYWGDDRVALIDLDGQPGQEEIWSIDVLQSSGCAKPYDVKVDKKGRFAYVTCSGANKVVVIDIVAQLPSHTIPSGNGPRDLFLTEDEQRLVVANSGEDTLAVLSVVDRKVLYKVDVGLQPYGVALAQKDQLALVTGWASGDLSFIDLQASSGTVVGKVKVGLLPYTVVTLAGDKLAYVTVNGDHQVVAVDYEKKQVVGTIQVGRNPWGAAPSVDGNSLLIANNRSGNASILTAKSGKGNLMVEDRKIALGVGGKGPTVSAEAKAKNATIALNGERGVITDLANNELMILDLKSGVKVKTISVGKAPYGIEFVR